MGLDLGLYPVTLGLVMIKGVVGLILLTVIVRRACQRAEREGRRINEREWSSASLALGLTLVSITDADLLRDTQDVEAWRGVVRGFVFLLELWSLSLIWRFR